LSPEGIFIFIGGSLATVLQVVFLGTLISKMGSKRIGLNKWELNKKEDLAFLAELFEAGKVVPIIDRRYPLSEVPEALRYLEEGRALGKVVIDVEHDEKT
jgi:NADPH:quinone reductase-like Zn-dependent oxidoreductase